MAASAKKPRRSTRSRNIDPRHKSKSSIRRLAIFAGFLFAASWLNYYIFFLSSDTHVDLSVFDFKGEPPIESQPSFRRNPRVRTTIQQDNTTIQQDNTTMPVSPGRIANNKTSTISRNGTLALIYPNGLFGGYRNQVIRFLAFVVYAIQHNYSQIFLPSLIWRTQIGNGQQSQEDWYPVPHEFLFDVEHWNSLGELPKLVSSIPKNDCWEYAPKEQTQKDALPTLTSAVLERGFFSLISDYAKRVASHKIKVKPRKTEDFFLKLGHCKHPAAYGGGKGAGRLWWDTMMINEERAKTNSEFIFNADAKLLKALQPKKEWREVGEECVRMGNNAREGAQNYVALHARIEVEILSHNCGFSMEKNLTKIFGMVEHLATNTLASQNISGVFVAVSRDGMATKESKSNYKTWKILADDNIKTLDDVVGNETRSGTGLHNGNVPVFVCGQGAVQRYYDKHPTSIDLGSTLESMVNFYVATEATAFVGVRHSSYSTDIWTTRYYQGKGDQNYEYTQEGIVQKIEKGGLPPPHGQCSKPPESKKVTIS